MAKLTKEEIIASLKEMTVVELNDLVKAVEEEFGVTAAAPVAVAAAPAEEEAAAKGPSEVSLTLTSFGAQKVAVIKAVVAITGLGLMDAKKLVDAVPSVIKESVPAEEAKKIAEQLKAVGATVELK